MSRFESAAPRFEHVGAMSSVWPTSVGISGPTPGAREEEPYLAGFPPYAQFAAHELGHAIMFYRLLAAGQVMPNFDYAWSNDTNGDSACPVAGQTGGHSRTSDEATVDAIREGFAIYYSLTVFNRRSEGDAFLFYASLDWDHTNNSEYANFSYEQRPMPSMPLSMNVDYWEDQCAQAVENVASEYDWARGLWDLDTDWAGISTADILDVMIAADPATFHVAPGTCSIPSQPPFPPVELRCPGPEILDAAALLGFGAQWAHECRNGICR